MKKSKLEAEMDDSFPPRMWERLQGVVVRNRIGARQAVPVAWNKYMASVRSCTTNVGPTMVVSISERPIVIFLLVVVGEASADSIKSAPARFNEGPWPALAAARICGSVLWQSSGSLGKSTKRAKPRNFAVSRKAARECTLHRSVGSSI